MDGDFTINLCNPPEDQVSILSQTCADFFARKDFVDCTLCCADGQVQAHRVILASASSYMYNLLSNMVWPTPCSHPMLFFKSFTTEEIKLALEFIYTGKANVSKNKLPKLMNISHDLGCTSLSKAIEKAIETCGVELFRRRMNQKNHTEAVGKVTPPPRSGLAETTANISHQPQSHSISLRPRTRFEKNTGQQNQNAQMALSTRFPDSSESCDEFEHFSSDDVKIEPVEAEDGGTERGSSHSILRSKLVTPTMKKVGPKLQEGPVAKKQKLVEDNNFFRRGRTSEEAWVTNSTPSNSKLNGNSNSTTCRPEDLDTRDTDYTMVDVNEEEDDDGSVTVESDELISHHEGYEDDDMPITVVDLKSLAEPVLPVVLEPEKESTGEKSEILPANCPWCFQVFTSLTLLQRHIKTHVGNYKPYACDYCPATFARSAHLKRHIRTHTGEKPFVCAICQKAFSRQDKLKIHLERHLQGNQTNSPCGNGSNASQGTQGPSSSTRPALMKIQQAKLPRRDSALSRSSNNQLINCPASVNSTSNSAHQMMINTNPPTQRNWPTTADNRVSKTGHSVNQITISASAISPSTTITPVSAGPPNLTAISTSGYGNQMELRNY